MVGIPVYGNKICHQDNTPRTPFCNTPMPDESQKDETVVLSKISTSKTKSDNESKYERHISTKMTFHYYYNVITGIPSLQQCLQTRLLEKVVYDSISHNRTFRRLW